MIRAILGRFQLKDERGGIAILTALGFLLFSVPLITSSLNLAQNTSIDARVKTNITQRHYCGLAVQEYLDYLLSDDERWSFWLTNHVDPGDPLGNTYTETIDPCGKNITLTVSQQDSPPGDTDDPVGEAAIPLSAYGNRDLQVTKTVSDPNPAASSSVTFTINVLNRSDSTQGVNAIRETLPTGFSYDCSGPDDLITLPDMEPQVILPDNDPCPSGVDLEWDMDPGTTLETGESITLTFTAVTSAIPGTYCNHVEVTPGGDQTRSGPTALVQIGLAAGLCEDDAIVITKSVASADWTGTNFNTSPFTYSFDIDFTITVTNIGEDDLTLKEYIDILPEGFAYLTTNATGDITEIPKKIRTIPPANVREEITWEFTPLISLPSGASKTLDFRTTANITKGDYWSDLLVDLGGGSFDDIYTWPTALVSIKDVFNITAVDEDGNFELISLQVWIGDLNGVVNSWVLQ